MITFVLDNLHCTYIEPQYVPRISLILPSKILREIFNLFNTIAWLPFSPLSVLNCLLRAVTDARHTVSTVITPDRFAILETNVIERAPSQFRFSGSLTQFKAFLCLLLPLHAVSFQALSVLPELH